MVEIQIDPEIIDYLQRLEWEVSGLRVLCLHAINAEMKKSIIDELMCRYQESFDEYELAKQEFFSDYIDQFPNSTWSVDFHTGMLTIIPSEVSIK